MLWVILFSCHFFKFSVMTVQSFINWGGGQGEPPNKLVKREIRKEEGRKKREVRLGQVQAK